MQKERSIGRGLSKKQKIFRHSFQESRAVGLKPLAYPQVVQLWITLFFESQNDGWGLSKDEWYRS